MLNVEPNYVEFSDPRLASLYDTLNPFSDDSEFFCKLAGSLSAKTIIDLGCGTGLLTCELANRGHQMFGIEPAEPMLNVARSKPFAEKITWMQGSFEQMEDLRADMVLMTSHVAQFFLEDKKWKEVLETAHGTLKPSGHLVFDIRRLTNPPFVGWPTEGNRKRIGGSPQGPIEWWFALVSNENQRVRYELHYFFMQSSVEIVSVNELSFRSQEEITQELYDAGFTVNAIYGNWDGAIVDPTSPEMIFVAKRN